MAALRPLFEYEDYKAYLADWLVSRPSQGHGERKRMAKHLRCHGAYVSQVMRGTAHLNLEQADGLNSFLGHSSEESRYFLLLVQSARAGTPSLRTHFKNEIQSVRLRRQVLERRLDYKSHLSDEGRAIYYSSWMYVAVHMLASIPGYTTSAAIARALKLSKSAVDDVLRLLVAHGLVEKTSKGFRVGSTSIHLGNDSPFISKHHINWRLQAIHAIERDPSADLHYSAAITLSEKDMPRVKEEMIRAIERIRAIVKPSENEKLCCYTLDFFELV